MYGGYDRLLCCVFGGLLVRLKVLNEFKVPEGDIQQRLQTVLIPSFIADPD